MDSATANRSVFFDDLRSSGQRVVGSFGAGGARANEVGVAFKEIIWPFRDYFDADFTASGGGIGVTLCDVGYTPDELKQFFQAATLRDVVDVYSTWAILYQNMKRLRESGLGINSGDKLRGLFRDCIVQKHDAHLSASNSQGDRDIFGQIPTSPPLHILATPYSWDHAGIAFIFSQEHTPEVSVSRALMASCAEMAHFSWQRIQIVRSRDGVMTHKFGDAAMVEPLPLVSVLKHHIAHGHNPRDLTIIGAIPFYNFSPPPLEASLREHLYHTVKESVRNSVINQVRYVTSQGARVIVLGPNVDFFSALSPRAKNLSEVVYRDLNIEHFPIYYTRFLNLIGTLFDRVIEEYFAHKDRKIIMAYIDRRGNAKARAQHTL